jgi:hypothetical protein
MLKKGMRSLDMHFWQTGYELDSKKAGTRPGRCTIRQGKIATGRMSLMKSGAITAGNVAELVANFGTLGVSVPGRTERKANLQRRSIA